MVTWKVRNADMNKNQNRYSAVLPVFRPSSTYLGEAITSALSQTIKPAELIVVLDGELSDEAAQVLDSRVTVLSIPLTGGVARARHMGISRVSSDYVLFLDQDDVWLPDHAERAMDRLERHAFVVSNGYVGPTTGQLQGTIYKVNATKKLLSWNRLLLGNTILSPTQVAIQMRTLGSLGGWPANVLGGSDDWLTWLTAARSGVPFDLDARPSILYRRHPQQNSLDDDLMTVSGLEVISRALSHTPLGHDSVVRYLGASGYPGFLATMPYLRGLFFRQKLRLYRKLTHTVFPM